MGTRQTARSGTKALMEGYKSSASSKVQVYGGRPASIYPPTLFIDAINEASIISTRGPRLRAPAVDVIAIRGLFDSEEAADAQDAMVDDFLDYVRLHFDISGGGVVVTADSIEDLPAYVPEWIENAPIYYASRITLVFTNAQGGLA